MTLGEVQRVFTRNTALLITHTYNMGFELTYGEAFRSDEQAAINAMGEAGRIKLANLIQAAFPDLSKKIINNGKADGVIFTAHAQKLAIDLSLFHFGTYLTETASYRFMGDYWKGLHSFNRWGGDFTTSKPDGNHFSMEFGGIQ